MPSALRNIIKLSCTTGCAIGLLLLITHCGIENKDWEDITLTVNDEYTWVQGVNFLGAPTAETTYMLEDGNLTLKIKGNAIDYKSLVWRVNKEVQPVLGSEKYLSREDLQEGDINVIAICLGKKGPCKSVFISLKSQAVVLDDFEHWEGESEMDEEVIPESRPTIPTKIPISRAPSENSPAAEELTPIPIADEERAYNQQGRVGFSEKQRCPNGDQFTFERSLKITLLPSTYIELKSFRLFATDNGKIDVLIQGENGEKWRINGRSMVGGSASEINLESLACELQPDVRYTITVNAAPNMEFENLQGCQFWSGGNEHLKLVDAGQGGAFFDIRYKY